MTARRRQQMRHASRSYYARTRSARMAAGLTVRGTPRRRRTWTELGRLDGIERQRERQSRVRAAFIAAGLNWRGRPRTRKPRPELANLHGQAKHNALCRLLRQERRVSALEQAYRQLRAEIESPAELTATSWTKRNA